MSRPYPRGSWQEDARAPVEEDVRLAEIPNLLPETASAELRTSKQGSEVELARQSSASQGPGSHSSISELLSYIDPVSTQTQQGQETQSGGAPKRSRGLSLALTGPSPPKQQEQETQSAGELNWSRSVSLALTGPYPPDIHQHATKIQACYRGYITRTLLKHPNLSQFSHSERQRLATERLFARQEAATLEFLKRHKNKQSAQQHEHVGESLFEEFRHGEIVFEDTGTVTKFLVVPDSVDDPETILRVMLGDWGMPIPNMTISVQSTDGDYLKPVKHEQIHAEDLEQERSKKEQHFRHLWDKFPAKWGEDDASASYKFRNKTIDMMYGICRAAGESNGWIVSKKTERCGGDSNGAMADCGVEHYKSVRQSEAQGLVNLAFGEKRFVLARNDMEFEQCPVDFKQHQVDFHRNHRSRQHISNVANDVVNQRKLQRRAEMMEELWNALVLRLDDDNAVKLHVPVDPSNRLVYPDLGDAGLPGNVEDASIQHQILRNHCSHFVFTKSQRLNDRLKILTEDLVPHVSVVMSGKDGTWEQACDKVARGAQVILLKNSGKVVDRMIRAVEGRCWKQHQKGHKSRAELNVLLDELNRQKTSMTSNLENYADTIFGDRSSFPAEAKARYKKEFEDLKRDGNKKELGRERWGDSLVKLIEKAEKECEMGHLGHLDTQALKELARDLQCDVTNEQRRTELIQQIVEKEIPLDFPDSIDVASFLIFDVLEDTPDRVIEQLTRALATVGGDEMREMGFAQTEKERLTYAWELCVLYRHNAERLRTKARTMQTLITLIALGTTISAVLLTASTKRPDEHESSAIVTFEDAISLSTDGQSILKLTCTVAPMISAFLLALAHKFSYGKRWGILTVAGERVCSEIYLYRARVGQYRQQGSKNAKLAALVGRHKFFLPPQNGSRHHDSTTASVSRTATPATPAASIHSLVDYDQLTPVITSNQSHVVSEPSLAKTEPADQMKVLNTRETFHDNLHRLQNELMGSEVNMASLQEPSQDAAELVMSQLYPFQKSSGLSHAIRSAHHSVEEDEKVLGGQSRLLEEGLSDFSLRTATTFKSGKVVDNGVGLISAEDYLKFRLLPAISRLNKVIPKYERWYNITQAVVLFATMAASVFGVIGLHLWIPAVGALVAAVESHLHFDQTSARLIGANGALTQLKNLRLWWQSLSRTQQSLLHNKAQLIESAEEAIESELSAWTQGLLRKTMKVDAAHEDEEDVSENKNKAPSSASANH